MTTVLVHESLRSIDDVPLDRRVYVPIVARWAAHGDCVGVTAIDGNGICGVFDVYNKTFVPCDDVRLRDTEHAKFASSIIDTVVRTDLDTHRSCATYRLMLIVYSTGLFAQHNLRNTSLRDAFHAIFPVNVLSCIMGARGVVDGEGMPPVTSLLFVAL